VDRQLELGVQYTQQNAPLHPKLFAEVVLYATILELLVKAGNLAVKSLAL
jgi:hypothetical protein